MSDEASNVPQSTINNCESVLSKIGSLYCDRVLSDVTLRVGAREYPAHRLILCASSDVFQVMLLKPEWSESGESVVVLHEAEECVPQFGPFLRYLYTGTVTLTHSTVLPILALADKYNVQDLRVVCGVYMKQHVVSAAEHNLLLSWLQYCMASQHTAVATACLNHFKWNFEQVARTSDFLNCDGGLLTSVLAQHDLVVHDEMTLYTYVVNWLNNQESRLQVAAPDHHRASRHSSVTPRRYGGSITPPHSNSSSIADHFSTNLLVSQNKQFALLPLQPKLDFQLKEETAGPDTIQLRTESSTSLSSRCCSYCSGNKCNNIGEATPMDCSTSRCVPSMDIGLNNKQVSEPNSSKCSCSQISSSSINRDDARQQHCHNQSKLCSCPSHHCLQSSHHKLVPSCNVPQQQSLCKCCQHHDQCLLQQQCSTCHQQTKKQCSKTHSDSSIIQCWRCCTNHSKLRFDTKDTLSNAHKNFPSFPNTREHYPPKGNLNLHEGNLMSCNICRGPSQSHRCCASGAFCKRESEPLCSVSGGFCRGESETRRRYSEPPPLQLGTGKLYLRCTSKPEDAAGADTAVDDVAQQMECLTYEVMSFVRFPMMTPRQLADLLLVPLTIHYKEFFVTRMAIGMAFHSGQWSRVREVVDSGDESSRLLFTPRLYTAEQWSAGLTVDNLPALPSYHTRTLVFSTPASASELENEAQLEWIVELYPKGVWFRKYLLIVWHGTVEVPEAILRSVRLSVTYNSASNTSNGDKTCPSVSSSTTSPRVRLAVLIYAYRDGVEFVSHVVTRRHIFSPDDNLLNMDDILPFDSLNDTKEAEQYLLPPCNSLKIHVVISPLSAPAYCPRSSS